VLRAVLLSATVLVLSACASSGSAGPTTVQVSVSACGQGWTAGPAGREQLVVRNTDSRPGSVEVIDARTGAVYLEVEPLAAGTTETVTAELGAGRYAIRCFMEDEPAVTGPTMTLTGAGRGGTPAVAPVGQGDLLAATKAYQRYVEARLPVLQAAVVRLRDDVAAGSAVAARRDWLAAHGDYLSLGAAYSAFGDLDAAIDGRADGLPGGVADPSWRGLHRIEYGLWHGEGRATLVPAATRLVDAVRRLRERFPHAQLDPAEIAIRAHEITEDAVEFALTGRDDYGSHSALATVRADLSVTRTVLDLVRPLLTPRYPTLPQLDAWLRRTARDVAAAGDDALADLPRATRERVDADVGRLAELLAPVAAVLEPRRTS
jgi:iron uptake system component EfeO